MRRLLLAISIFCLTGLTFSGCVNKKGTYPNPWRYVEKLKAQIRPPSFLDRTFLITDYGAVSNGVKKNTLTFKEAIQAAHDSGGGRVVVPKGTF